MNQTIEQALPTMERLACGYRHHDWHCVSIFHPEEPNRHYFVHRPA